MAKAGVEKVSDEAYVTLATNDSYALGALVLSQSLRGVGASRQIVAMITDGVSITMRDQLLYAFDALIEVDLLDSKDVVNLELLSRTDLGLTFTKLHCWRLIQFKKCVFLDADTLVLQNIDELFSCEELAAAPDIGWPDCFNSGVFVYRPSQKTYESLLSFALTHGSFDGGDQGLLNLYFNDWSVQDSRRRLPFLYNVVATAFYSYPPAYKQFGSAIKVVHFIGAVKPWHAAFNIATRSVEGAEGHSSDFLNLWWTLFIDRVHHRLDEKLKVALLNPQESASEPLPHPERSTKEMTNLRVLNKEQIDDGQRQYNWEKGQIDYMGVDSFDNILKQLEHKILEPTAEEDRSRPGSARDKARPSSAKGRISPRPRSSDKTPSPTKDLTHGASESPVKKFEQPLLKSDAPRSGEKPSEVPRERHTYVYPDDGDQPLATDFISWIAPVTSPHHATLFVSPTLFKTVSQPASVYRSAHQQKHAAATISAGPESLTAAGRVGQTDADISSAKTHSAELKHHGHEPHLPDTASSTHAFSTTGLREDSSKLQGIQSVPFSKDSQKSGLVLESVANASSPEGLELSSSKTGFSELDAGTAHSQAASKSEPLSHSDPATTVTELSHGTKSVGEISDVHATHGLQAGISTSATFESSSSRASGLESSKSSHPEPGVTASVRADVSTEVDVSLEKVATKGSTNGAGAGAKSSTSKKGKKGKK